MIQITFSSRSNNTKCCSKHRTAKNFRVHIQPVFVKSLTKGIRDTTVKGYNQNLETSTGVLASGFLDVAGSGCMSIGSSESTHVRYTGVIQMEPLCCPLNGAHRHTTAAERPRISGAEQSRPTENQRTTSSNDAGEEQLLTAATHQLVLTPARPQLSDHQHICEVSEKTCGRRRSPVGDASKKRAQGRARWQKGLEAGLIQLCC